MLSNKEIESQLTARRLAEEKLNLAIKRLNAPTTPANSVISSVVINGSGGSLDPDAPNVTGFSVNKQLVDGTSALGVNQARNLFVITGAYVLPTTLENLSEVRIMWVFTDFFQGNWSAVPTYPNGQTVYYTTTSKYYRANYISDPVPANSPPGTADGLGNTYWTETFPKSRLLASNKYPFAEKDSLNQIFIKSDTFDIPQFTNLIIPVEAHSINNSGRTTQPTVKAFAYLTITALGETGPTPDAVTAAPVLSELSRTIDPADQTAHGLYRIVCKVSTLGTTRTLAVWLPQSPNPSATGLYDYIGKFPVDTATIVGTDYVTTIDNIPRWIPVDDTTWVAKVAAGNRAYDPKFAEATSSNSLSVLGLQNPLATDCVNMVKTAITGPTWNDFALQKDADGTQYFGLPDGLTWDFSASIDTYGWYVELTAQCVDVSGNAAPAEKGGVESVVHEIPYKPGTTVTVKDIEYWEFNPVTETTYVYMQFRLYMHNRKTPTARILQTGINGGNSYYRLQFGTPPTGTVEGNRLIDLSVITSKVNSAAITLAKMAALSVDTAQLLDAAATTLKIADANITHAKMALLSVDTAQLFDSAATTLKIADANITNAKMALLSVNTGQLFDAAATSLKIADANITNAKMAANSVASANIINATIVGADIANATILTANIGSATILAANIASGTITSVEILNATIVGADIASATILTGNIGNATILAANIQSATITTTEIANATILGADIASATILGANIGTATILTGNIGTATILAANLANATITNAQIASATILTGNIASATILGANIASATITSANIASINANIINAGTISVALTLTAPTIVVSGSGFTVNIDTTYAISTTDGTYRSRVMPGLIGTYYGALEVVIGMYHSGREGYLDVSSNGSSKVQISAVGGGGQVIIASGGQVSIGGNQIITNRQTDPGAASGWADATAQGWANTLAASLRLHGLI